jgi:hypothetical protein
VHIFSKSNNGVFANGVTAVFYVNGSTTEPGNRLVFQIQGDDGTDSFRLTLSLHGSDGTNYGGINYEDDVRLRVGDLAVVLGHDALAAYDPAQPWLVQNSTPPKSSGRRKLPFGYAGLKPSTSGTSASSGPLTASRAGERSC